MKRLLFLLLFWLYSIAAYAQSGYVGIQNLNLSPNVSQYTSFSANTVSYPWVTILNYGVADIHFRMGIGNTVASGLDPVVQVGNCLSVPIGTFVNFAAIAPAGPATVRILQSATAESCTFSISNNMDSSTNAQSLSGLNLLGTMYPNAFRKGYEVQAQDTQANCGGSGGNSNGLVIALDDGNVGVPTIIIIPYAGSRGGPGGSVDMSGIFHQGRIRFYGTAGCQVSAAQW